MVRASRCRPDGAPCVGACPHGAIRVDRSASLPPIFERTICAACDAHDCVPACLSGALEVSGRRVPVRELMRILERDRDYWGPEGGVSFSGGEPMSQPEFLLAALGACREAYIHTVVETSAHADPELVADVARRTDWLFVDLKHMDAAAHRRGTGVGNERILANLTNLARFSRETRVVVRIPIVPGFNDSPENLRATARFLSEYRLTEVNLLPFHRMAESKYAQLGLEYRYAQIQPPTAARMADHRRHFSDAGLRCYVGAETPF